MVMSVSRCLFEGRCVRKIHGRVYLKDTQCVRKTHGRVHKRASRRCSLCVRVALFAAFSPFEHLADVIIFNVNENQYGDCIQNSGGWVMVERRECEAKVQNSIN